MDDDAGTLHTLFDMPRTLKVKTSRGFHYYFKHDDWSRSQRYGQKENAVIDIPGFKGEARCNNQYVVAFGSIHPSGAVYELIDDVEPVAAPFELLQWLQQSYANSESRKGRLIKEEKKPLDPSKPHLLVKGPPPDEGFKALIEKVGTDPLRLYMNAHEDDRFHNPTLGNGADDYCPIPSHGPIRKEDYWTPCFGQVRGSDILHCLGCGWSGDVIKAIRDIYELPTMYEAARKICRDSGLDFEEFFPPPPPKSPQDEPDWDEIKKSEVEQEDKQTEKKKKDEPVTLKVDDATDFVTERLVPRKMLLSPFLTEKSMGMIHAWRGVGKTHVGLGMAVALATGGQFLKWKANEASPVLYVDGEMADEDLQLWIKEMLEQEGMGQLQKGFFEIVSSDRQVYGIPSLFSPEGQLAIESRLKPGATLFLDNISCLFRGNGENEGLEWEDAQTWLLSLRRRGHSIIVSHHDGKSGAQRGTSKREDPMNWILHLKHPKNYEMKEGLRAEVYFEKARRLVGDAAEPFEAILRDGKWQYKEMNDVRAQMAYDLHVNEHMSFSQVAKAMETPERPCSKSWAEKLYKKHKEKVICIRPEEREEEINLGF